MGRLLAETMFLLEEIGQNPTTTIGEARSQPGVHCGGATGPDTHNWIIIYGGSANEILCRTGERRCWLS